MTKIMINKDGEREFIRFGIMERMEHIIISILFAMLVITGLPQRFYEVGISQWIIINSGGIDMIRLIHRISGIMFSILTVFHLGYRIYIFILKKGEPSIIPNKQDFRNAIINLRYYMGFSEEEARSDRFDYKQKFEYWGLVLGGMVMIASGFLLYFPILFTKFLPGEFIPAAKLAHSNEAMLALSVVVIWHMYGCIFSPEVFPLDKSIFTGRISEERIIKEHPLEYERIIKEVSDYS